MGLAGLREGWEEGRAAWPGLDLDEPTFAAYAEAALGRPPARDDGESAPRIFWRELYLACGCARGMPAALAAFEAAYFHEVDAAVRRRRGLSTPASDVRQLVRQKLFVAEPGAAPKIAMYGGRGELRTWLRVLITRLVANLARKPEHDVPVEEQALTFLLGGGDDPEIEHIKRVYREEFRAALADALAELAPRDRALLRLAFSEGLTVDAIGTIYRVHRATAARWVAKAHEALVARVHELLKARLEASTTELESVLRLIRSRVDVTIERYLRAGEGGEGA